MAPFVTSVVGFKFKWFVGKMLPARKNTKIEKDINNTDVYSSYSAKLVKNKKYTSTKIFQCGKSKPIQMHIGKICILYWW